LNKRLFPFFISLIALLLASLACSFSASTANINDAWLSHDADGEQPTIIYSQDEIFYCNVEIANAPDDTNVKVKWTAVDVEGEEKDTFLKENEFIGSSDLVTFNLSNSQLWPTGTYKAEIYLNDEFNRTLEFTVHPLETVEQQPAPTEPPPPPEPPPTEPVPAAPGNIRNAFLAHDEDGTQPTTVFGQGEIFYAIVELTDVQEDLTLVASWYAVQAEGVEPNYLIDSVDVSGPYDTFTFNLSNDQLWPLGLYKVEISMNGELATTLEFEVR
jgi:hypothetical protein